MLPFAPDVHLSVKKNTPETVTPDVFDEDGDPLTITSAAPSADHGTVTVRRPQLHLHAEHRLPRA